MKQTDDNPGPVNTKKIKKEDHVVKKSRLLSLLLAIVLAVSILLPLAAAAEGSSASGSTNENDANVNVVILIDKSGSMKRTDPEGKAKSAARQFVDIITEDDTDGNLSAVTDLAILAFNQDVYNISKGFHSIKDKDSQKLMKDWIDDIEYADGDTDIGLAMKTAQEMLQEHTEDDEKNVVLLFTDGKTDNVDLIQSEQYLQTALSNFKGMDNISVYAVGWNYNNSLKAEGIQAIRDITNTVQSRDGLYPRDPDDKGGRYDKGNYLITNSWGKVRELMTAVAEDLHGGIAIPFESTFTIDSSEIVEAHIIISSDQDEIKGVNVLNPNGDKMKVGSNYTEEKDPDGHYMVCKLKQPAQGEYTVQVDCNDQDAVSKLLVKRYAIEAKAEVVVRENNGSYSVDTPNVGVVMLQTLYDGNPYTEASFINSVDTKAFTVQRPSSEEKTTYTLEYDENFDDNGTPKACFVGFFPIVEEGIYGIEATIATPNMKRLVVLALDAQTGISVNDDGSYSWNIGDINVRRGGTKEWKLDFSQPSLTFSDIDFSDKKLASADITVGGSSIIFTGNKKGETSIDMRAQDQNGAEWNLQGRLIVGLGLKLLEIILLVLILILIVVAAIAVRWKTAVADGLFTVTIQDYQAGYIEQFSSQPPKGTQFSLWLIINQAINRMVAKSGGNPSQRESGMIQRLQSKKKDFSSYVLFITSEQTLEGKKVKTYNYKHDKFISDLSTPIYKDNEMMIALTFIPAAQGSFSKGSFGGGQGSFGGGQGGFGGGQGGFGGGQGGFGSDQGGFGFGQPGMNQGQQGGQPGGGFGFGQPGMNQGQQGGQPGGGFGFGQPGMNQGQQGGQPGSGFGFGQPGADQGQSGGFGSRGGSWNSNNK